MLENQDQDLTLTDLSHNTLNFQLSQNLNMHQSPVMIKDILYYNYSTKPEQQQQVHVINQNVSKSIQNQEIMSPSSNSSSSPAPSSVNPAFKLSLDQHDIGNKSQKKSQKKKSSQATSEIDEERTSQLVSEILRNIKEKTKELESLNQNLKSTNISEQKSGLKLNNVCQNESELSKNYSQDSFSNELNDSNEFYDSDGAKSQSKPKKLKPKNSKTKSKKILEVPQGWNRILESEKTISYISPTGFRLKSHQDVKNYLLSDQTCKCGLECPLNIYDTFNFNPSVEIVNSKKSIKNSCLCKHSCHGIKKQKNLVKVLDEVNQNSKRVSNDKKLTSKKTKSNAKSENQLKNNFNSQNSQIQDASLPQQFTESISMPSFVMNQESDRDQINFGSNDLLFDEKNFGFENLNSLSMVIKILKILKKIFTYNF